MLRSWVRVHELVVICGSFQKAEGYNVTTAFSRVRPDSICGGKLINRCWYYFGLICVNLQAINKLTEDVINLSRLLKIKENRELWHLEKILKFRGQRKIRSTLAYARSFHNYAAAMNPQSVR